MVFLENGTWGVWTRRWCVMLVTLVMVIEVMTLNGPNVCMVKQKYNITKRVKYRAPMTVRTYEWCFSMPPRCSRWNTEMRDLTRLETDERTAEVAVCCPGYKMKDVSCVPICPSGKTGSRCFEECPPSKWGPNCVHDCGPCEHGACSPSTGECLCRDGWQGESCGISMSTTTTPKSTTVALLTTKPTTKVSTTPNTTPTIASLSTTTTIELSPTSTVPTTESFSSTTSLKTTSSMTSPKPTVAFTSVTTVHKPESTTMATTELKKSMHFESTTISNNESLITLNSATHEEKTKPKIFVAPIYNGTEMPVPSIPTEVTTVTLMNTKEFENVTEAVTSIVFTSENKITVSTIASTILTSPTMTTETPKTTSTLPIRETFPLTSFTNDMTTSFPLTTTEIIKIETTNKPETTIKVLPTTTKFKPKEIWIKPAQKGEATFESKKIHDNSKHRSVTNNEFPTNTTPKTIIVSIIPTSVSYATFKKIAFTTASFLAQKTNTTIKSQSKSTDGFTKPMSVQTITPIPVAENLTTLATKKPSAFNKIVTDFNNSVTTSTTSATTNPLEIKTTAISNKINSTIEITSPVNTKLNSSNFITTISSTNDIPYTQKHNISTNKISKVHATTQSTRKTGHAPANKHYITTKNKNITKSVTRNLTTERTKYRDVIEKINTTKSLTITNRITTEDPADEETFHILTEPEHITAVMGDKETGRSSVDLISVISIAGGVMMTVITVAVVIVMIERCKRPRYEDVRKINDIRMQVMIDNDAPPPYVRSIFHAPLPDPPSSEKCHYQPISTLDRNLKQFMRPVVVQTISPIMLENFRGILECHYDHLPRRSHDFATIQTRHSIAPSMSSTSELRHIRARSMTESTIEALKCEAKLDVIDNTTAEPLYAEIPCWRPPSEHAIEIMNINGEAVTEL